MAPSTATMAASTYIELDHDLVPGKLADIGRNIDLPGRQNFCLPSEKEPQANSKESEADSDWTSEDSDLDFEDFKDSKDSKNSKDTKDTKEGRRRFMQESTYLLNKYEVRELDIKDLLIMKGVNKEDGRDGNDAKQKKVEEEEKADEEAVIGSSGKVLFDHDFGLFSAILACYNNHWVVRTSPDHWWNVIVRNVAQTVDDNGDKEEVRDWRTGGCWWRRQGGWRGCSSL